VTIGRTTGEDEVGLGGLEHRRVDPRGPSRDAASDVRFGDGVSQRPLSWAVAGRVDGPSGVSTTWGCSRRIRRALPAFVVHCRRRVAHMSPRRRRRDAQAAHRAGGQSRGTSSARSKGGRSCPHASGQTIEPARQARVLPPIAVVDLARRDRPGVRTRTHGGGQTAGPPPPAVEARKRPIEVPGRVAFGEQSGHRESQEEAPPRRVNEAKACSWRLGKHMGHSPALRIALRPDSQEIWPSGF